MRCDAQVGGLERVALCASSLGTMLVPRIVAAGLLIAVGLVVVGGGAGVAAIKIWSYPVELVPKPSTATSFLSTTAAKKKNDASFVVDHALPKIIRKRMATEGVMTKVRGERSAGVRKALVLVINMYICMHVCEERVRHGCALTARIRRSPLGRQRGCLYGCV